jgi:hypothetical protein
MVPYDMIPSQNDPERLRHADGEIISGENPIMTALDPLGFRFRKTLGQGGGGIAMLVDLLDRNGKADQWVVKLPVGGSSLLREARNMRVGQGAAEPSAILSRHISDHIIRRRPTNSVLSA